MSKSLVEIQGFAELHRKLLRLSDGVKRKELLKLLGQVANPTLQVAKNLVPVSSKTHYRYVNVRKSRRRGRGKVSSKDKIAIRPGNLRDSLKKIVAKRSKVNPRLDVGAKASRFKNKSPDGYYAHMVVSKGHTGISRKGANEDFLNKAYQQTKGLVTSDAEKRVSRYIQRQINRLSK